MASALEGVARSQVIFREVNERIAELSMRLDGLEMNLFICECSNEECAESLEITPSEYQAVRAHGARFFVLAGHQLVGVEHVVEANRRFLVVERTERPPRNDEDEQRCRAPTTVASARPRTRASSTR